MGKLRNNYGKYWHSLFAALRDDLPIYALIAAYLGISYIYVTHNGETPFGILKTYVSAWSINFGILAPYVVTLLGVLRIFHRLNKRRTLAYRAMFAPSRVGRFVAGTILLMTGTLLFTAMFSSVKTVLPKAHGFRFDMAQANIDKALHFGVDPFHWLYAVAKHPFVLDVVQANYNIGWFIICYFTLYWVATSPRAAHFRIRYFLTWLSAWIIVGSIIAGIWISAGPAYYGLVTGDSSRFAEQMAFIAEASGNPSSAHDFQAYLWSLYASGQPGIGSGISAFPSMHVSLISVNALFLGEYSRKLGIILWGYVAFVMASSVYLGWHYAIDGYVGVAVVTLIYWGLRTALPRLAGWRSALGRTTQPPTIMTPPTIT